MPIEHAGRTFNPIHEAPQHISAQGGNKRPLMLQTHGSKFVQFQEVKIQEMASEASIPPLRGERWPMHIFTWLESVHRQSCQCNKTRGSMLCIVFKLIT